MKVILKIFKHSLNKQIIKASGLTFTSLVFAQGISFIVFSILAKIAGAEFFGKFNIIYNSAILLSIIASFGLNVCLTKLVNENLIKNELVKIKKLIAFAYQLCFAIVMIVIIVSLLFPEKWANIFSGSNELWGEVFLSNIFTAFYSLCTIQIGILLGFKNFKGFFYSNLFRGISLILIPIGYTVASLYGTLIILIISTAIQAVLNHYFIVNDCKKISLILNVFERQRFSEQRELINLAIPFLLSSIFVYPITWITNRMMVNYPSGYNEIGIFAVSFQIRAIITFIPSSLGNVILPVLSTHFAKNDIIKLKSSLRNALLSFSIIGLLMSLAILVSSEFIINFYASSIEITNRLLLATAATSFIMSVQMPFGYLVNALGKMWTGFWLNLLWAILLLGLSYSLIDGKNDAYELTLCYLIAYTAHATWTSIYVYFSLKRT